MSSVDHVVTLAKPLRCTLGIEYPAGQIVVVRRVDDERARCISLSGAYAGRSGIARQDDIVCEVPFGMSLSEAA